MFLELEQQFLSIGITYIYLHLMALGKDHAFPLRYENFSFLARVSSTKETGSLGFS